MRYLYKRAIAPEKLREVAEKLLKEKAYRPIRGKLFMKGQMLLGKLLSKLKGDSFTAELFKDLYTKPSVVAHNELFYMSPRLTGKQPRFTSWLLGGNKRKVKGTGKKKGKGVGKGIFLNMSDKAIDKGIGPYMPGYEKLSPKAKQVTRDIVRMHETFELKEANKLGKGVLPMHSHKDINVLLKESNILASIKDPQLKKELLSVWLPFRMMVDEKKDIEALMPFLGEFYGTKKLPAAARKALHNKALEVGVTYNTRVRLLNKVLQKQMEKLKPGSKAYAKLEKTLKAAEDYWKKPPEKK